jgi:hypothetical protein
VRSGPGEARTILLLHIISVRPSKQPLMVVSARTNKRHHHLPITHIVCLCEEQIKGVCVCFITK